MSINEIEKLYENAGIEPVELDYPDNLDPVYPLFTAEKQIELIKCLARSETITINETAHEWQILTINNCGTDWHYSFENCLAQAINFLWQSLTEEEKEQIRKILK